MPLYLFPALHTYFAASGVGAARTLASSDVATTASGIKLEKCMVVMLVFWIGHLIKGKKQRNDN